VEVVKGKESALALESLVLAIGSCFAQTYPNRPITIIVPFPAGGATDGAMRRISKLVSAKLGQPVIVDNKPGASGTLGPNSMARVAKPDGYTLSQITINLARTYLIEKGSVHPFEDFSYIAGLVSFNAFGVFVKADSPFKTFQQLVDYAKANPGKLSYATTGIGTSNHLNMEEMAEKASIQLLYVPFKGGSELMPAVLGGHVMVGSDLGWEATEKAGKIRVLATFGRTGYLPTVPTATELGYDVVVISPFGIAGPKGMDANVVQVLQGAFKNVLENPDADLATFLSNNGMTPYYQPGAVYRAWMTDGLVKEQARLTRLGLMK